MYVDIHSTRGEIFTFKVKSISVFVIVLRIIISYLLWGDYGDGGPIKRKRELLEKMIQELEAALPELAMHLKSEAFQVNGDPQFKLMTNNVMKERMPKCQ